MFTPYPSERSQQIGERVEALGLTAQGLGQHSASQVSVSHAVAAAAL